MLRRVLPVLLGLLLAAAPLVARETPWLFTASNLPPGWRVVQHVEVPASGLAGFTERLGAPVVGLQNQVLDVAGISTRWNVISAADEAGARRIEAALRGMRGADFVARRGANVYEVAGTNVLLARAVFAAASFEPEARATYDVAFRAALVDHPDYTTVNDVFNHFLALERGDADEAEVRRAIEARTAGWTFGRTLRLRASSPPEFEVAWTFAPAPATTKQEGDLLVLTFEDPPTLLGIPYVDVGGRIQVPSRFGPTGRPQAAAPTAATDRWPREPVAEIAREAVAGVEGDRARALALLTALRSRVGYGGAQGSRDPIADVLARGTARCWDASDVFVALCRAVGLPARQVAGWVPALGAGHVWTEVHLAGEGWLPVDATTPWLGTGTDYIPFFLSEDGELPFLYLGMPRVTPR